MTVKPFVFANALSFIFVYELWSDKPFPVMCLLSLCVTTCGYLFLDALHGRKW